MTKYPKVAVITLNWNGEKWLDGCLSSVLAMDYPNFNVIVADNGSKDRSVELIREKFSHVHIVELGKNLGYARGFNAGLEYAASQGVDYFLIMNNDTVIDKAALSALMDTAQSQPKAGFVTGKSYYFDHPDILQTIGKKEDSICWSGDHMGEGEKDIGQYEAIEERAFLDDVMTLVNRKIYDEVGGYDPQFFLDCEEFDWQVRAKKKGWKFYYTPKAKVWHMVGMSRGGEGNPIARYFNTRNYTVVMALHAGTWRFLRYYVWRGFRVTDSLLRGLVQISPAKIKARLATWLGFVGGTFWLIHRRPPTRVPWIIRWLV